MISDVCIITEGSYPYIMGGVSTWIAQLIESMPDLQFSVFCISSSRKQARKIQYKLPPNLAGLQDFFIMDSKQAKMESRFQESKHGKNTGCMDILVHEKKKKRGFFNKLFEKNVLKEEHEEIITEFLYALSRGETLNLANLPSLLKKFSSNESFIENMVHNMAVWNATENLYRKISRQGISFFDYFWNFQAQFVPVLNILRANLPKARVYHTACTGYAGLLGARAAYESGRPLLLTEHGIYSRERYIELSRADWLSQSGINKFMSFDHSRNWFRELWAALFSSLSKTTYDNASKILTLYKGNMDIQIAEGAPENKIRIIPNGIPIEKFIAIPRQIKGKNELLRIGFVGRVVKVKDIKTMLRALSILNAHNVNFNMNIVGPLDEEPEYVDECLDLTEDLNLTDKVFYPGKRYDLDKVYAEMDLVILTSISEGFPYMVLEANCAGLPVVATDVGACRNIIEGMDKEDMELGPSGRITFVGQPERIAAEIEFFANNPSALYQYGMTGRERVRRYYDIKHIMNQYKNLYYMYMTSAKRV